MVRLDKIIYMITSFKSLTSGLEESQYSSPKENIIINDDVLRVLSRLGVVASSSYNNEVEKKFLKAIPFGRESFLLSNMQKHSKEFCKIETPNCQPCDINDQCDYYNNKNQWVNKENV